MVDFTLTDENKLVREAVARLRRGRDPAVHPRLGREGRGPSRGLRADGRARVPGGADPRGLRRGRDGLHQLRDPVRGARACRHRVPCRPERPRRAQLAGPAPVGDRGAATALAGPAGARREAGDLRPDRARRRDGRGQPRRRPPAATATPTGSTARRSGSRWRTSPTISWSSPRSIATKKHKGVTAFILERGMAGLTTGTLHGKLGIRAGNTGLINLDDVPVPVEHRIGEEGEGFLIAMSAIDQGRFTVAAGAVGLAQACLDASVRYAHERHTFGQEIGEHQLVKQMIAKMAAGTEMGRLLVWRAALAQEPGPAQHARDEPGQVARHRTRGPERARRDPGPRRQRLLERVPGRALPAQLEGRGHLRGDEPAPHAHPGRLRARISRRPADPLRAMAGPGLGAPAGMSGEAQLGRRSGLRGRSGSSSSSPVSCSLARPPSVSGISWSAASSTAIRGPGSSGWRWRWRPACRSSPRTGLARRWRPNQG